MENLLNFFQNNFATCVWLACILVALIPTLESKIAIPFAMSTTIWGTNALPAGFAFLFAFIGSILPSAFAFWIGKKINKHTTGFISEKFAKRYVKKTALIEKQSNVLKKYSLLASFVAIPLPLTGVWTGSLIAGICNLKTGYSLISIVIGSLISCGIITLLCTVFENSITYILLASILIIISYLVVDILITILKKIKLKKSSN